MLSLVHRRLEIGAFDVPCEDLNRGDLELIAYQGDGLKILNARTRLVAPQGAKQRYFCTWSGHGNPVSGPSLVFPWFRNSEPLDGFEYFTPRGIVTIRPGETRLSEIALDRRRTTFEIMLQDDMELYRYQLFAKGFSNTVYLRRIDGFVVAVFPPLMRSIQLHGQIDEQEIIIVQVLIGTEIIQRARRFAFLAQFI